MKTEKISFLFTIERELLLLKSEQRVFMAFGDSEQWLLGDRADHCLLVLFEHRCSYSSTSVTD